LFRISDEELIEKLLILGANVDDELDLNFVPIFPIEITFKNGDVWEVKDLEKLEKALKECED